MPYSFNTASGLSGWLIAFQRMHVAAFGDWVFLMPCIQAMEMDNHVWPYLA